MRSVPVNRGNGFRQRGSLRQNALKLTIDKIDKSLRMPLFRAIPLLQFDNITPSGSRIFALEVMFYGIGKHFCLDLRSSLLTFGRVQACLALLSLILL